MDITIEKWQNPSNCNLLQCSIPTAHSPIPTARTLCVEKHTILGPGGTFVNVLTFLVATLIS